MPYLDFAATSAIRPEAVARAVADFLMYGGASPGRGGYRSAVDAGRIAFQCRRRIAKLLALPGDPGRVCLMHNATHALNTAVHGILRTGDAVVTTAFDHNAVLRPVHHLACSRGVQVRMVSGSPDGSVDFAELDRALDGARLLVVNHVSNVLGTVLPLGALAERAHAAGALVLVDVAQSAGHLPSRPAEEGADLIAITGHKGLLGPQGTGALWIRDGVELSPLLTGGTGGASGHREMPETFPDRIEAGTPNIPGIAGLVAGLAFLEEEGVSALHARESRLKALLREGLDRVPGVRVLSPPAPGGVGIVSFVHDRIDPATLGRRLESEHDVLARTGLHCAPEVHALLGTSKTGAVRFSLGWASTPEDVDRAVDAVEAVTRRTRVPSAGTPEH